MDYLEAEEALWTAISHTGTTVPEFTDERDYLAHPENLSSPDFQ